MGNPKPKVCKCGHDKNTHKNKPKSIFTSHCRSCHCNSYMNRNAPFKSDYVFMIFSVSVVIFIVGLLSVFLIESNPELTKTQDELANVTKGALYSIMVMLFSVVIIILVSWLGINPILDILSARKRISFPIAETTNLD